MHAEATRAEDTDGKQILQLYGMFRALAPGPMVTLNRIVAVAMVDGPRPALTLSVPEQRYLRIRAGRLTG